MSCRSTTCCKPAAKPSSRSRDVELQHPQRQIGVLGLAGEQVVEQQALLQRGQRIHVGHVGRAAVDGGHDLPDLRLGQLDQRQHRRVISCAPSGIRFGGTSTAAPARQRPDRPASATGTAPAPRPPHRRPQPLHQRHRQQRMPAQSEEVVVDTDRVESEHLREHRAQELLLHGDRRPAGARGVVRRGQRRAVQLPVRGQRQLSSSTTTRRDHVLRQPPRREGAQVRFDLGRRPRRRPTSRSSPGTSSRTTTAACATSGCASSAACTSPGSIRNPRIFTCSSARPSEHQLARPAST